MRSVPLRKVRQRLLSKMITAIIELVIAMPYFNPPSLMIAAELWQFHRVLVRRAPWQQFSIRYAAISSKPCLKALIK